MAVNVETKKKKAPMASATAGSICAASAPRGSTTAPAPMAIRANRALADTRATGSARATGSRLLLEIP